MRTKKFIFILAVSVFLTLGLSLSLQSLLAAWSEPSSAPPGGNVAPPIYTQSSAAQTISGGGPLMINGGSGSGELQLKTNVSSNHWSLYDHLTTGDFNIWYGDNRLTIKQNGNVGIGITNPTKKLQVTGDIQASGDICSNDGAKCLSSFGTTVDHGSLAGLGDDDHLQYLLASGARAVTGNFIINGLTYIKGGFTTGVAGADSGITTSLDYRFGYQEAGAWTNPYPDLVLGYHTGVKIGGHSNYGGTRFYNDHPGRSGATEIFSVGENSNDVRVFNTLYVNGALTHDIENPFYINSYDTLQLRINSSGGQTTGVFGINNSANSRIVTVDNGGKMTVLGDVCSNNGTNCLNNAGDITGVTAGTGLTGGGTNGTVMVSLNTAAIGSCTNSVTSKIYWDGSRLVCGTDQSGSGGDGNNYVTGINFTQSGASKVLTLSRNGLSDLTASFTGIWGVTHTFPIKSTASNGIATISLDSCSSGQILKYNGSSWACAADNTGSGAVASVSAGANGGLTISPTTGAVVASLQDCAANQILKRNSGDTAWACAADNTNTGTVTSVGTGAGLSGGTITTSGTVSLNTAGISSCTNSATSKIYWDSVNSRLICGTDQSGTGGTSDHGSLAGLGDDDHAQYLLTSGARAVTGNFTINGQQLNHPIDNAFYINSYNALQLRINSDGTGAGVFGINNSDNTRVLTVDNTGTVTALDDICSTHLGKCLSSISSGVNYWKLSSTLTGHIYYDQGKVTIGGLPTSNNYTLTVMDPAATLTFGYNVYPNVNGLYVNAFGNTGFAVNTDGTNSGMAVLLNRVHIGGFYTDGTDIIINNIKNNGDIALMPPIGGGVGINTIDTGNYTFKVVGSIAADSYWLSNGTKLADYVFEPDYNLETIEEHADFMWANKHLKSILSAQEVEKAGTIELGSQMNGMLEELEKAHIYIDQLNNKIKTLEKENDAIKSLVCLDHPEAEACQ